MTKSVFEVEVGDIVSVYNQDFITDQVYRLGAGSASITGSPTDRLRKPVAELSAHPTWVIPAI